MIRKEDNPHLHPDLWDNKTRHKMTDRSEGWGWIAASASTMMAWGIVVAIGYEPNFGILFGSMGMGAWKVFRNGRW